MNDQIGIVLNSTQLFQDSLPLGSLGNASFLEYLLARIAKAFPDVPKVFAMGFWNLQELSDDLRERVEASGFSFFVGDRDDGARLRRAAMQFGLEVIVDIDARRPLTSLHFCREMVAGHLERGSELTLCHNLPPTLSPRVVSRKALGLYCSMRNTSMMERLSLGDRYRTVPETAEYSQFMSSNPEYFKVHFFEAPILWPGAAFDPFNEGLMALQLDGPENMAAIRDVVYTLNKDDITSDDIIDYQLMIAMRRSWDREQMFDTRYAVVDQHHMSTAKDYDDSARREAQEVVLEDAGFLKGASIGEKSILELGCGMARLVNVLADSFSQVHGTDASPHRYLEARYRMRGRDNVFITQNDGRSLSQYADGFFDFAFAHGVLVHIHSKSIINNYIKEFGRVLKSGGRAKFDIYYGKDVFGAGPRYFGVGARYTEEEITEQVEASGMKVDIIRFYEHQQFDRNSTTQHCRMKLKVMRVICEKA